MYPVLKIMHMLNFLDTFSMGITIYIYTLHRQIYYIFKYMFIYIDTTSSNILHLQICLTMNAMSVTRLYMHVVPNLSPSSNILGIRGMLLILSTPSSNTTSLNRTDHECMNTK